MPAASKPSVLAICGSTRSQSTNLQIIKAIARLAAPDFNIEIYQHLTELPHFNPDLDGDEVPELVQAFRNQISAADGVLICTPEYVFSLPGSLKNAIEWTVSTTLFADKPTAIITASGLGKNAHESLQLIMKTVGSKMTDATQLLIEGARTKLNSAGEISDSVTLAKVELLVRDLSNMMNNKKDIAV